MRANHSRRFIDVLVLTAALTFTTVQESNAYLDLGTGSYLLQVGLATLFAWFFLTKRLWLRIISFFRLKFKAR